MSSDCHKPKLITCYTSAIQYNTIQYNTIQYNTIQYNTIQYNTIQYNTIHVPEGSRPSSPPRASLAAAPPRQLRPTSHGGPARRGIGPRGRAAASFASLRWCGTWRTTPLRTTRLFVTYHMAARYPPCPAPAVQYLGRQLIAGWSRQRGHDRQNNLIPAPWIVTRRRPLTWSSHRWWSGGPSGSS
jgi:hypothetical protein